MSRLIYTDNNATTRVADEVFDAMVPYFTEYYGNPSSMYAFAEYAHKPVENAREQAATLINAARTDEIVFTSCGTESDNAAIFGVLHAYPEKKHFITTAVEHPAVYNLCDELERQGYRVTKLRVNSDVQIDLEELRAAITGDTALVSIMWANNETGTIYPVEAAADIAHEHGVPFHTDAVQAAGKVPIDVQRTNIDLLSLSGHKIHAQKGVGLLYIKRGTRLRPFFVGGHQEHGRRAGTENVPGIVGLGKACEMARAALGDELTRVKTMRDRLETELLKHISYSHVNGDMVNRTPNTTNITFEFIEGESMLLLLSDEGICASSGSACTSGSLEPSHVLIAAGVPPSQAHSAVRFSLSRYNTDEEIDYIINRMPGIIERLRNISPFKPAD
jgi:cysteine desulfurase